MESLETVLARVDCKIDATPEQMWDACAKAAASQRVKAVNLADYAGMSDRKKATLRAAVAVRDKILRDGMSK